MLDVIEFFSSIIRNDDGDLEVFMILKKCRFLFLSFCTVVSLGAMDAHQIQSNDTFMYCVRLAHQLFLTGISAQDSTVIVPAMSRFILSDYATHAICNASGLTQQEQKNSVGSLVDQCSTIGYAYATQDGKKSICDIIKLYIPYFVRSLLIDYAHTASTRALNIEYPSVLNDNGLFRFFCAPIITGFIKESIFGSAYNVLIGH